MSERKPQLDALTGARGIAAWYVVLYHIRLSFADSLPGWLMTFSSKGYLAVDLFFVLSGFVMWLTYGAKFATEGVRAAPDFYVKRLARIYPLHFFVLMMVLAYVGLLWMTGRVNPIRYPLGEFPLHLLLVQNWGMTPNLAWNDPDWSISTEMAAYLIFPLVAVGINRVRLSAATIIGLLLALAALLDIFMTARAAPNIGFDITQTGLIRCLIEFFSGVLICILWLRQRDDQSRFSTRAFGGGFLILAGLCSVGLLKETFAIPLIGAAGVYLLAQTSNLPGNFLGGRILRYVGDISYSTYLVHYPLWTVFKLLFVRDVNHVALALMFLYLLMTLLLSALLYWMIEQPGRSWFQLIGRRALARRQANRQPLLD
jgi:peptidoglycan/LPS O-acetylase OafA/YrhL